MGIVDRTPVAQHPGRLHVGMTRGITELALEHRLRRATARRIGDVAIARWRNRAKRSGKLIAAAKTP